MTNNSKRRFLGVTLVEVLIAMVVIATIVTPVYFLFSSSRKMTAASQDLVTAMGLANSYISSLREVDKSDIPTMLETEDKSLTGKISLNSLRVSPCPTQFNRHLTVVPMVDPITSLEFTHLKVSVKWVDRGNGLEREYVLSNLANVQY